MNGAEIGNRARACFFLAVLLAAGCTPSVRHKPARTFLPAGGVSVPLQIVDETLEVQAEIDGKGPFRFLLDTGFATAITLTPHLAETLGLAPRPARVQFQGASGETVISDRAVAISQVAVGKAVFRDLDGPVVDLTAVGVDGILGFPLFRDCLLILDCGERTLTMKQGALPPADGQFILRFQPQARANCLDPRVPLRIADREVWVLIDSGFGGAFEVPRGLAGKLAFASGPRRSQTYHTLGGQEQSLIGILDGTAWIGAHRFDQPTVLLGYEYRIGTGVLQHFTVTFDQRQRRARFLRKGSCP